MITRLQALRHSPPVHKVLVVLAIDAATSITLILWERAHQLRKKVTA